MGLAERIVPRSAVEWGRLDGYLPPLKPTADGHVQVWRDGPSGPFVGLLTILGSPVRTHPHMPTNMLIVTPTEDLRARAPRGRLITPGSPYYTPQLNAWGHALDVDFDVNPYADPKEP